MQAAYNGILTGLFLSVLIGPVFFSLIQTSIKDGVKAGIFMALGVVLSDALYLTGTYFLSAEILRMKNFETFLAIGGSLILLAFGVAYLYKKSPREVTIEESTGRLFWKNITKGFLLNGVNPSVLVFWLGVTSLVTVNFSFDAYQLQIYFVSILATIFATDVVKAYGANRIKSLLNEKLMMRMNKAVGVIMIIFGIRLALTLVW